MDTASTKRPVESAAAGPRQSSTSTNTFTSGPSPRSDADVLPAYFDFELWGPLVILLLSVLIPLIIKLVPTLNELINAAIYIQLFLLVLGIALGLVAESFYLDTAGIRIARLVPRRNQEFTWADIDHMEYSAEEGTAHQIVLKNGERVKIARASKEHRLISCIVHHLEKSKQSSHSASDRERAPALRTPQHIQAAVCAMAIMLPLMAWAALSFNYYLRVVTFSSHSKQTLGALSPSVDVIRTVRGNVELSWSRRYHVQYAFWVNGELYEGWAVLSEVPNRQRRPFEDFLKAYEDNGLSVSSFSIDVWYHENDPSINALTNDGPRADWYWFISAITVMSVSSMICLWSYGRPPTSSTLSGKTSKSNEP